MQVINTLLLPIHDLKKRGAGLVIFLQDDGFNLAFLLLVLGHLVLILNKNKEKK